MERLGFVQPIRTGDRHAIFERDDAAMTLRGSLAEDSSLLTFHLGARDESDMRRILRAIQALELELEVASIHV